MANLTGHVAGDINITGSGGTDDYRELTHKPKINNIPLNGDLSLSDLGIPENAVQDVKVDGYSVVNEEGTANITLPEVPVQDVKVDGDSVVNEAGTANITLPEVPVQDVKVDGDSVVNAEGTANITLPEIPVQDVKVDGESVVNGAGVANITIPDAPVRDVTVDGESVVNEFGEAEINIPVKDVEMGGSSIVNESGVAVINIPSGTVLDVKVDGDSVVTDGVANISMPTVPDNLTDLSDIDIDTPSDGDVLTYDSDNDKWVNAAAQGHFTTTELLSTTTTVSSGSTIQLADAINNYDIIVIDFASAVYTDWREHIFLLTSIVNLNTDYTRMSLRTSSETIGLRFKFTDYDEMYAWGDGNRSMEIYKIIGIKF